jgi:hypothetical protein
MALSDERPHQDARLVRWPLHDPSRSFGTLITFAGSQAINTVFALSVVALYFAYAIPIAARFMGDNKDVKPGPFSLGMMVSRS